MKLWPLRPATRAGQNAIATQMAKAITANRNIPTVEVANMAALFRLGKPGTGEESQADIARVYCSHRSAGGPNVTSGRCRVEPAAVTFDPVISRPRGTTMTRSRHPGAALNLFRKVRT